MMKNIVALESTVIAKGLPNPFNVDTALEMETIVKQNGAAPKTIGIISGEVKIGLTKEEIKFLAVDNNVIKVGTAELAAAIVGKRNAATTVSATIALAKKAGIKVFATGGIGGVHRQRTWDVSQDIAELSRSSMIVVCSGFKSILDIERTIELLETSQITTVGFNTEVFPLFHSRTSNYRLSFSTDNPSEIRDIFLKKKELGLSGAVLVLNPVPEEEEIDYDRLNNWVRRAVNNAEKKNITGKGLTPFLLTELANYSNGQSVRTNISLLKNNARVAANIANTFS
ncbi:MAG: pseudouridine-5'-phosphate glycosidase [Thermotogota bacterium]|nr:pseudouridine-5'-phosphate glycosidase [Thermotogota bacterium]